MSMWGRAVDGSNPRLALPDVSLVDNVVNFNANRDPGTAGFGCVVTDVEFSRPSVNHPLAASLAKWKQFHEQLKARLQSESSDMALVAYIQGPDSLVDKMNAGDQPGFMQQQAIQPDAAHPGLYDGASQYFATQDGKPIVDAIAPMWYVRSVDDYTTFLDHTAAELQALGSSSPYLIAGVKVSMQDSQGDWCTSDCLQSQADYASVLAAADQLRLANPTFIGTAVYKWPLAPGWSASGPSGDSGS